MNAALTDKEARVFAYICAHKTPVTLAEIAADVFSDLPEKKGNSWVRNSLRKLRDVLGLVRKVGKGMYVRGGGLLMLPAHVEEAVVPQPEPEPELELVVLPIAPVQVMPPRPQPQPAQLQAAALSTVTYRDVEKVKNIHCTYYSDCLSMAVEGGWEGFGCHECNAYVELGIDQKAMDWTRLIALDRAAENEEELGCSGRKRGVKPGSDRPRKLKVVGEEKQVA